MLFFSTTLTDPAMRHPLFPAGLNGILLYHVLPKKQVKSVWSVKCVRSNLFGKPKGEANGTYENS